MPEVAEGLDKVAATPVGGTPQELGELVRRETRMWGELVKARGIEPAQ